MYPQAGVEIAVGDEPAQLLDVQTCDATGRFAGFAVEEGVLSMMNSGGTLEFIV